MRASYQVLGGVAGDDLALVVRLKNLPSLIQREGGTAGALAYGALPQTIANTAYNKFKEKLLDGAKVEGVDMDVQVISTPILGTRPKRDFLIGMSAGAGAAGLGYLLWRLIRTHLGGRR